MHTVKKSPSNGGNAAHSGSVVMLVLAISSVTTEHLTIHKRNRVAITGTCFILGVFTGVIQLLCFYLSIKTYMHRTSVQEIVLILNSYLVVALVFFGNFNYLN